MVKAGSEAVGGAKSLGRKETGEHMGMSVRRRVKRKNVEEDA